MDSENSREGCARLADKRCFHHGSREAAARCPCCERYYCRECITEHEDRVVCATCLKALAGKPSKKRFRLGTVAGIAQVATGVFTLWILFYYLGQALLHLPVSFHEGKIWQ
ncbi:MAG: rhomboid family protein [Pseudomonadota bacterium]